MKPSQLASQLRHIATSIDKSQNPDRKLVSRDLKKILASIGHSEGSIDTSWSDENETVTLEQILEITKNIKVQEFEIEKLKKIVLNWDGNTEEIEKIEKSDTDYPVLILVNDDDSVKYILDGNHRIQKSIKHNKPTIKAKLIQFSKLPNNIQKILG